MSAKSNPPATGANGGDATGVTANGAVSAMSREFINLIADAEDLIKATTSLSGEDLVRIRAQLAEGVAAAKQSIDEMGGAISQSARQTGATTNAYVHEQPWKAIGASATVAFLLGLLVARRS